MTTGQNKPKVWLLGARVWCHKKPGNPRDLYLFLGQDSTGLLIFVQRRGGTRIGLTIDDILKRQDFRPFLINNDYLGHGKLIVKENEVCR